MRAAMLVDQGFHRFLLPFTHSLWSGPLAVTALRGLCMVPDCVPRLFHDGAHLFVLPLLGSTVVSPQLAGGEGDDAGMLDVPPMAHVSGNLPQVTGGCTHVRAWVGQAQW